MDNRTLIELLKIDAKELANLADGLTEIDVLPPALLTLAKEKTKRIYGVLGKLHADSLVASSLLPTDGVEELECDAAAEVAEQVAEDVVEPEVAENEDVVEPEVVENEEISEKEEVVDPEVSEIEEINENDEVGEPEIAEIEDIHEPEVVEEQPKQESSWISRVLAASQAFRHHRNQEQVSEPQKQTDVAPEAPDEIENAPVEASVDEEVPQVAEPERVEPEEEKKEEETQAPASVDLFNAPAGATPVLGEQLNRARIVDINQGMTLGDRFYYQRTLFAGKGETMAKTILALNKTQSMEEATRYVATTLGWDFESEDQQKFMAIVARLFA